MSFDCICVESKCLLSPIPMLPWGARSRHGVDNPKNCPFLGSKSISASLNLEGFKG